MVITCTHLDQVLVGRAVTSVEPGEDWSYCYLDDARLAIGGAR